MSATTGIYGTTDHGDEFESYGLTNAGIDLVLALLEEAGDGDIAHRDPDAALYGFTGNHPASVINAAADGDVAALVELRAACGLPILR